MIASFTCRTKYRIHWFGGQVWVNKHGFVKYVFKLFDKLIFNLTTSALTECESQKNFLIKEKIVKSDNLKVLGFGSICGVDNKKFKPSIVYKNYIRKKFNISNKDFVILFLGRIKL